MEPKIIKGHFYRCKNNIGNDYTAGRFYECRQESIYPDGTGYGSIVDNYGVNHAWSYDPENNPIYHDRWTDHFEDMGEKPAGMILIPYTVGDTVKFRCVDDGKVHRTEIASVGIDIDQKGRKEVQYIGRIKLKGCTYIAMFTIHDIKSARL